MDHISQYRTIRQPTRWESEEGSLFPLGATFVAKEQAWNFAIYSKHARSVTLNFYQSDDYAKPVHQYHFDRLRNKSGPVWHCRLPAADLTECRFYGYQISGPPPESGFDYHAFDPEKVLLDPYARAVFFPPDFERAAAIQAGSNAGRAPLGLLDKSPPCNWGGDAPVRHDSDLVIYEMHVRGFTRHESSGLSADRRGTFRGVIDKIPYLVELGITAVELMPVFQFDPGDGNYWGYMPLNFFAPDNRFSTCARDCQVHCEFREMVQALHAANIEVILDVVYNHTCEGDHRGPVWSFKGIDNSTYYLMQPGSAQPYANYSGTGNTLHTANRAVRQMIVDSLRYWVCEMHVDGFRFDLASVFSRNEDGSVNLGDTPIFGQIAAENDLAGVRLIAEPWDASGVYQLGSRFPGVQWMQWNDSFRDCLQKFVRGDEGMVPELMTRLYGSADLFPDDPMHAMRPFQSVNYLTSHDGFTLYDLVSYDRKRNQANGQNNEDGHDDFSWNCGWEGDDEVPGDVQALRTRQAKNHFCLLLLANGTPMFRMGDEFLNTQFGNSNPFNQDNETSWLDWNRLESRREMFLFARHMIQFRKSHPSLSRSTFWRDDIHWYGSSRQSNREHPSHTLAYCLLGDSLADDDLYVMINAGTESVPFVIFEGSAGQWRRAIDTSLDAASSPAGRESPALSETRYTVQARSIVVLTRKYHRNR